MSRSSGGRPTRSSHPLWPPLRRRALLNGLGAALAGAGLLWLTWGALDFTVFDASEIPAVMRVLTLWFAVGLPLAWLAIGLHLLLAGLLSRDRELLARGAAEWEPEAHDDVLRGVRIRSWRLGILGQGRRLSGPTLGWLPELSPVALAPLGLGILVLLGMIAWMARGYGAGVIALIIAILWLGWRLLRAWQAWTDVRDLRARRAARRHDDDRPGTSPHEAELTPDEAWESAEEVWDDGSYEVETTREIPRLHDDEPPTEQIAAVRRVDPVGPADDLRDPPTSRLEVIAVDPDDAPIRRSRRRGSRSTAEEPLPEVLVDRSVQRAIRARQAAAERGAPPSADSGKGRGRGRGGRGKPQPRRGGSPDTAPQGLRAYLGQRSTQGAEDSGSRALRDSLATQRPASRRPEDVPFDQSRARSASRSRAAASQRTPTAADAEQEIYGRDEEAPSLLSYLSRRRGQDDDS